MCYILGGTSEKWWCEVYRGMGKRGWVGKGRYGYGAYLFDGLWKNRIISMLRKSRYDHPQPHLPTLKHRDSTSTEPSDSPRISDPARPRFPAK